MGRFESSGKKSKIPFNKPSIVGREIEYIVQAFLRIFYDDDGFNIEIMDSRHDKALAGMVMTGNEVCNFQTIAAMLMPTVDPSAWV